MTVLSSVHTGDEFGGSRLSPFSATICRRIRRQSPKTATVAKFGDCRRSDKLLNSTNFTKTATVAEFGNSQFRRQTVAVSGIYHLSKMLRFCAARTGRMSVQLPNAS